MLTKIQWLDKEGDNHFLFCAYPITVRELCFTNLLRQETNSRAIS